MMKLCARCGEWGKYRVRFKFKSFCLRFCYYCWLYRKTEVLAQVQEAKS